MAVNNSDTEHKRVVLITGCSAGGIGHFLALEFAARGCKVYASARNTAKLDGSLSTHGIEGVELDVGSTESIKRAVQRVVAEAGRIDVLVNNAGQICVGPVVEVDMDTVQRVIDVNVTGVARVCQVVAPHMMDRHSGLIVNIGSVSGYMATPWVGYYAASKAAVHTLSDALRLELAPFNVGVTVVAPGSVKSNLVEAQELDSLLCQDSRYALAADAVRARAELSQKESPTPTDQFARVIVPQLLGNKPRAYITYGGNATITWLMYFVPPFLRDVFLSKRFGTKKLGQDLSSGSKGMCPVTQRRGGQCPVGMARQQGVGSGSSGGIMSFLSSMMTRCPVTNPAMWVAAACVGAALYASKHPEILYRAKGLLGLGIGLSGSGE
ncbi:NADPH-dependent 1-acyl dihydroxyacetone phosphate reductase [Coemansia sp. Benny D115]|nr:NADPH-dependent 1-acyl dihydroxyacetone phosphate reductase [Coemansia sp. Benny D115]